MRNMILLPALLLFGVSGAQAQRVSDRAAMANAARPETGIQDPIRPADVEAYHANLMVGGIMGAGVVGVAGGYMGYSLADSCGDGWCELGGLIAGVMVGEIIGIPLGVRAAGGRGSLPAQMLVSAAVFGLGAMAVPVTAGLSLLAVVPIQLHLVVKNAKEGSSRAAIPAR